MEEGLKKKKLQQRCVWQQRQQHTTAQKEKDISFKKEFIL